MSPIQQQPIFRHHTMIYFEFGVARVTVKHDGPFETQLKESNVTETQKTDGDVVKQKHLGKNQV